jgi:hypothetical protein
MTLSALMKKGALREVATAIPATAATEEGRKAGKAARVATVAVANPRDEEIDALPDPAAEARRQRVLAILAERPGIRYAVLTDIPADPDAVILTLAIRGKATCELRIPRDRYDPYLLLDLLDKHRATVH